MEKFEIINGGICAAKGFKASGLYCGIKHGLPDGNESAINKKNDIAMIFADVVCNAAGVYTSNKVKARPFWLPKTILQSRGEKPAPLS